MSRVISICNRKGGCGKTTSSVSLATALAIKGYKVLLLDTDPQAHTSLSFGARKYNGDDNLFSVLIDGKNISDMKTNTYLKNLHILTGSKKLSDFEKMYGKNKDYLTVLSEKLNPIQGEYDFILLDTPPTLGMLTVSSLIASTEVYVPMLTHYLGFDSLYDIVKMIYTINRLYNPKLRLKGIIPTFYKKKTRIASAILKKINYDLGPNIVLHPVRVNIALAEAPGFGQTIYQYNPNSSGAYDYLIIAEQIVNSKTGIQVC